MLLLNSLNSTSEFTSNLNEEWHCEFHKTSSPREFHDGIWSKEIIAGVETYCEELLLLLLYEEFK